MRARKGESFHERSFAKEAKLEKQRQAFNNEMLEEVVSIPDSDEEPSVIDESIEEKIMVQNANLVPIAPRKSKSREAPPESSFDDVLMEKFKHGKPCEQAQILQKFNIIQLESPPNLNNTNMVEIDLASDSEDEAGRFSDGSSIHIEEDAMEVDQDIAVDTGHVGTNHLRNNSIDNFNNKKVTRNGKDQELINQELVSRTSTLERLQPVFDVCDEQSEKTKEDIAKRDKEITRLKKEFELLNAEKAVINNEKHNIEQVEMLQEQLKEKDEFYGKQEMDLVVEETHQNCSRGQDGQAST